ncbi:arylesterase [Lichenihabitans psoromatis]|uniref:arylesterase n=1 Tax=Lichenihabitans psoromatis TaxID=2528642 RepID=UPI003CCB0034
MRAFVVLLVSGAASAHPSTAEAAGRPVQVVALGDSLSAGYMLPADAAFPAVLQKALQARGLDVTVANAGVSGDTAEGGLQRLDWSVPDGTDAVILELGANNMLRGLSAATTKQTLDTIITRLQARGIKVLLTGMMALPSLGKQYGDEFQAIYPALAQQHGVPLYPFFLNGVAQNPQLKLADGLHPNEAGVAVLVQNILPSVEALVVSVAPKG